MKCRTVVYINKEDPRIFVYKHRKWKWLGVTLNFAHPVSFSILLITLGSAFAVFSIIWICEYHKTASLLSSIFVVAWLIALVWYYYRQAARDLKRYPGNLSAR